MSYFDDEIRYQFLIEFAYNGADFFGVQEQKNLKTVLGMVQERVELASGQRARCLFVAARTDRGVHALHNCATFYVKPPLDVGAFKVAIEAKRADGLYAVKINRVDKKVHARAGSGKIYRYTIRDGCKNPDQEQTPYAWAIAPKLLLPRLQEAAHSLVGELDFSSLRGGGCQAGTTVKELYAIKIIRNKQGILVIDIAGKSFLRKMIRNMVGLLVEIGAGLREPSCIPDILAQKNRQAAGIMAPAHGLMLVRVLMP